MSRSLHRWAAVSGCVLLLVVAAAVADAASSASAEGASTSGIWEALRTQLRDANSVPGATERVQALLEQLSNRLRAEQMLADAHHQSVLAFYNARIANLSESVRGHLVETETIKRRAQNVSFHKEQYQVHLSTLDTRIRVFADRIGKLEDKITAGDSIRKEENLRYQRREAETKNEILATNHMIDQLGAPQPAPQGSFAQALNKAVPKAPSFLELEVSVSAPSDVEELKDLASTLFDSLHAYLRKLKIEEGSRSYRWSVHKFGYQNQSAALQGRINALEATRIPTQAKLNETNAELAALPATMFKTKRIMKREDAMLDKLKATRRAVIDDYNTQTADRNQQLQTAETMYLEVLKHLGDSPAKPTIQSIQGSQPIFAGKEILGMAVPPDVQSPTR
jgi:chromosome segregation ATPase